MARRSRLSERLLEEQLSDYLTKLSRTYRDVPGSLRDAINEEPERFARYLRKDKIKDTRTFLLEFDRAFGKEQGLNLMPFLEGKYKLANKIYKEMFKEPLGLKKYKKGWNSVQRKRIRLQKAREKRLKKVRIGRRYWRTKPTKYSKRMINWLKKALMRNAHLMAYEFNRRFGTKVTARAIITRWRRSK